MKDMIENSRFLFGKRKTQRGRGIYLMSLVSGSFFSNKVRQNRCIWDISSVYKKRSGIITELTNPKWINSYEIVMYLFILFDKCSWMYYIYWKHKWIHTVHCLCRKKHTLIYIVEVAGLIMLIFCRLKCISADKIPIGWYASTLWRCFSGVWQGISIPTRCRCQLN